ncbi:PaaI family thioesterase [Terrihabitans sp. B22-R8]|uniref:PaaI family thioesterase n=1 Tax=Terrihabitans sp. B22-R8 TaxID=3425128 RepID=UPI00403C48B5
MSLSVSALQTIVDTAPYHRWLGIRVVAIDADATQVDTEIVHRRDFDRLEDGTQFHGGVIAAFIDTTGDLAMTVVAEGMVPTINLRVDYLRPAVGAFLRGRAHIRRSGRTLGVVDIDILDDKDRLVAVGRGTYSAATG